MNRFSGNRVLGSPRCFSIGTNTTPKFSFGDEANNDTWLKAEFVGEQRSEPLFNGRLYHSAGGGQTTVIDNFPKSEVPDGWTKRVRLDTKGYELVDDLGQIIFSYWDTGEGDVKVTLRLYGAGGQAVAYTSDHDLTVQGISFSM